MKRIVTILITLVMCFAIAFPANATRYSIDTFGMIEKIEYVKSQLSIQYPSDYKYVLFLTPNSPDFNNGILFLVSDTPYITVGSKCYYGTIPISGSVSFFKTPMRTTTELTINNVGGNSYIKYTYFTSFEASQNIYGVYTKHSTANFLYYDSYYESALNYGNDIDWCYVPADPSALLALISQAKAIQNIGYTKESWQALQTQITAAENLLATTSYTQTQVTNAKNALQAAIDGLVMLPDATELEQLLIEADTIDDIGYTVPTWTRFDNARYSGHALIARQSYTQTEVTDTTTELSVSMNSLTLALTSTPDPPKPPPSPLGYDLGTGDVSGYLKPVSGIFNNYVWSAWPIGIGIFAIVLSVVIIRRVLEIIIPTLRR